MKNIHILLLMLSLLTFNCLFAQDLVVNDYKKCKIFKYDYKNGVINNNSKEIIKIIIFNEYGNKLEEKYFWQGELSHTNNYIYDSINNLIEMKSIRDNEFYDFTLKYLYDSTGNNNNIYEQSIDGTITGKQDIEYDLNAKEIKHKYFDYNDSLNVIETYSYNENGFLATKKMSTFRYRIMEIIEQYKYDSDNLLSEINFERIPELVSRQDSDYWEKEEIGYRLQISIPLPPFEKKINFFYDTNKRLSKKITYYNAHAAININEYFYDESGILKKEILSVDYSPIKEFFKSNNMDNLYEELQPYHFTSKTGEPKLELIYNYSK